MSTTAPDNAQRYVLLVEDDPDEEALTLRALRRTAFAGAVAVARDGQEALDHLFGPAGGPAPERLPAVVLLDLHLPRVDGLQVLRRIRAEARTRPLPVVILTTAGAESDVAAGYDHGCNAYVRKPAEFDRFVELTAGLGAYWLLTNEVPPAGRTGGGARGA